MNRSAVFHETRPAMGTDVEMWLTAPDATQAGELFEAAFEEVDRVEATLSTYRPTSELSRINRLAAGAPVTTDPETFELLWRSREHSVASGGAFDITVGSLMRAWGFFRGEGRYPSDARLEAARRQAGFAHLLLDASRRTVAFARPGLLLDLGAIGKGYALDRAAAVLRGVSVGAALLGAGKSTYVAIGAPPGETAWRINVPDPVDRRRAISTVHLRDEALSTSGSYEKFFVLGGRTYCHILDPRTGRPVSGMLQATVVSRGGADTDALATATFVAGAHGAFEMLREHPRSAALIVTGSADARRSVAIRWPGARTGETQDRERDRWTDASS